jgi:hypothetical protein
LHDPGRNPRFLTLPFVLYLLQLSLRDEEGFLRARAMALPQGAESDTGQRPDQLLFELLLGLIQAEEKEFSRVIEKDRRTVAAHH